MSPSFTKRAAVFKLAFLLFGWMPGLHLQAQELGFRAGGLISDQAGENFLEETDLRLGIHLGGYGTYFITERWWLQTELLFAQKGRTLFDPNAPDDDPLLELSYIEWPLLLRYQYPEDYILEPYFIFGPYAAWLADAKVKDGGDAETVEERYRSLELGLTGGVGFHLSEQWLLDLRLSYGLTEAMEEDFEASPEEDPDALFRPPYAEYRNIAFHLTLGYAFRNRSDRSPRF
jgi:hypothetical protein